MNAPRENLLRVLRHKKPEWIPWTTLVDPYNIPATLPEELLKEQPREPYSNVKISRYLGGDILQRCKFIKEKETSKIKTTEVKNGDYIVTTDETPVGKVSYKTRLSEVSNPVNKIAEEHFEREKPVGPIELSYRMEFPIKDISDYSVMNYIYKNTEWELDEKGLQNFISYIGNDGAAMLLDGSTPISYFMRELAGLERAVFDLNDNPKIVEKLLETMAETFFKWYSLAVTSSAEVIMCSDDAETGFMSPKIFEKYEIPILKECANLLHRHGKIFIMHDCGHIRDLLSLFKKSGIDAVECVCPPKTGNTPFKLAKEIWGDEITIIGRIDPPVLVQGKPEELSAYLFKMLDEIAPGDNFMLTVPLGRAPLENIKVISGFMKNNGKYPIQKS